MRPVVVEDCVNYGDVAQRLYFYAPHFIDQPLSLFRLAVQASIYEPENVNLLEAYETVTHLVLELHDSETDFEAITELLFDSGWIATVRGGWILFEDPLEPLHLDPQLENRLHVDVGDA